MNRAEAHCLLDEIFNNLDAAANVNDPSDHLQHEDRAQASFQKLQVGVIGAVRSRRHAAALAARTPFDLSVVSPQAVDAGQWEWTEYLLRTQDGAAAARRVLARAVLDDPTIPPGLARLIAAALFQLNLGESRTWLGRPMKIRGLPGTHARRHVVNTTLLARIYYHHGYHAVLLDDAAAAVLPNDADEKRWGSLEKWRQRHGLLDYCNEMATTGRQDKATGQPSSPPVAFDYDLSMLEDLYRIT